jgi:lysophospholipid acyltransferase (LPLAT)-like uncharacterized protein
MWTFPAYLLLRFYRLFFKVRVSWSFKREDIHSPVVYAFWHGNMFVMPFLYRGGCIKTLVSTHRDGRLATQIMRFFSIGNIPGSSHREPYQAFKMMLKAIKKENCDIAITPDGPKGPYHKMKKGPLELAYLAKVPIVPIRVEHRRAWQLKSWDRFFIPKPLSEVSVKFLEPVYVNDKQDIERISSFIGDVL